MSDSNTAGEPTKPQPGAEPTKPQAADASKPAHGAEPTKLQHGGEPTKPQATDDDGIPFGVTDVWKQGYDQASAKFGKLLSAAQAAQKKQQSDFDAFQARYAEQDSEVQTLRKVKQDHTLLSRDFELTKKELEGYRKTEWEGLEAEAAKVLPEKLRGVLDPYRGKDAAKYRETMALLVETQKGQSSPGGAAASVRATPKWDVRRLRDEAVAGKQDYQRELIAQGVTAQQMKDELGALGSG